jgi:hypothetical protein
VDYTVVFGDGVGVTAGLTAWRIENFVPEPYSLSNTGSGFSSGDCFIILATTALSDASDLSHTIHYWIGRHTTLDKKASAAMNALSLRGYLKTRRATHREEEGDESPDFLDLFGGAIIVADGGTDTGFFHAGRDEHVDRLYALVNCGDDKPPPASRHAVPRCGVHLDALTLPIAPTALEDSRRVLLFDSASAIYLWRGSATSHTKYHRARLFAERFLHDPRREGQRARELVEVGQHDAGQQHTAFADAFAAATTAAQLQGAVAEAGWMGEDCKVFEARLGKGFLELPQVARKGRTSRGRRLEKGCLETTGAYIVDDGADIFVWLGRQSPRILQAAATRLVSEVERMAARPSHFLVTYQSEGLESAIFKSKFLRWDDVLVVDHRSPELVAIANGPTPGQCPFELDVSELFSPPREVISDAAATELEEQWKADLDKVDAYVLQGSDFVRLPKEQVGRFHAENCYVFLCKEWHVIKASEDDAHNPALVASRQPSSAADGQSDDAESDDVSEELEVTAYFWQGRDAGHMPWLVFSFSVLPKIRKMISSKLECNLRVVKETQFQESMRFMALFDRSMVVLNGHRHDTQSTLAPELYHVHAWRPLAYTRTVQVGTPITPHTPLSTNPSSECTHKAPPLNCLAGGSLWTHFDTAPWSCTDQVHSRRAALCRRVYSSGTDWGRLWRGLHLAWRGCRPRVRRCGRRAAGTCPVAGPQRSGGWARRRVSAGVLWRTWGRCSRVSSAADATTMRTRDRHEPPWGGCDAALQVRVSGATVYRSRARPATVPRRPGRGRGRHRPRAHVPGVGVDRPTGVRRGAPTRYGGRP